MAPRSVLGQSCLTNLRAHFLYERFVLLNEYGLSKNLKVEDMRKICLMKKCTHINKNNLFSYPWLAISHRYFVFIIFFIILVFLVKLPYLDGILKPAFGIKCILPNNYVIWEATRPIASCDICSNVSSALILHNVSREEFNRYAYSYRPIIVKGAALNWPATNSFNFTYFKELFFKIDGAFESVEEECQFLNFKSDFRSLKDVFQMSSNRVRNDPGTNPWYIGWSNCNRDIIEEMRRHYKHPHFLPKDAEHSHINFIFMGYEEGAFMHLDYISRLMWQAQLKGHKMWYLHPPPECESVCSSFSFLVYPGDILLLDTRQWYHKTYIQPGEFSLTVSSEYG